MSTYLTYLDVYFSFPLSFKDHIYSTNKKRRVVCQQVLFQVYVFLLNRFTEVSKKSSTLSFSQWHFLSARIDIHKRAFYSGYIIRSILFFSCCI